MMPPTNSPILLLARGFRARKLRSWLARPGADLPQVEQVAELSDAVAWSRASGLHAAVIDIAALDDPWLQLLDAISQLSSRVPVLVIADGADAMRIADCRNHGAYEVFGFEQLSPALLERAVAWGLERRRLEQRLSSAYRLETAGKLASRVTHELNNRLSVISGYSEMLELTSQCADQRQRLAEIRRAASGAAALSSRLQGLTTRGPAALRPVAVNHLVEELRDLMASAAGELFTLRLDLDPEVGRVRIDPFRLQEALVRLVLDAREAMPDGGRMVIETSNGSMADSQTGAGVAPCVKVSFACHAAGAEGRDGSAFGIGEAARDGVLAITSLVRQIGGRVEILEGENGTGASIDLLLPALVASRVPPSAATHVSSASVPDRPRVLLVEDDPSVLRLVARLLEAQGAQVETAVDGISAMRLLEGNHYDVLVTDLVLPRLSGNELTRAAKQAHPGIRVLVLSGYRPEDGGVDALVRQGCAFLPKPFSASDLTAAITSLLRGESPIPVAETMALAATG